LAKASSDEGKADRFIAITQKKSWRKLWCLPGITQNHL